MLFALPPNLGNIAVPCNSGFPMPASIKSCPLDQNMDYGARDCLVIRAPIAVLEVGPLEVCPLQPLSAGGEVSHLRPQSRMGVKPPHTCLGVTDSIESLGQQRQATSCLMVQPKPAGPPQSNIGAPHTSGGLNNTSQKRGTTRFRQPRN